DGNDALLGKDGDDYIDGGAGLDVLMGGKGADSIFGGSGIDIIYGSSTGKARHPLGRTEFLPDPGHQLLGRGFNWFLSTPERDRDGLYHLYLSEIERDEQWDDKGNYIDAGSGEDDVFAGTGNDIVYGGDDADDIKGMAGSDVLYGEGGGDRIHGDGPIKSSR